MKIRVQVLLFIVAVAASGCASNQPLPLLFGQTQTVGLTINGSVPEQGGELSLAYRDRNIAVIPIQSPIGAQFDAQDNCKQLDPADTSKGASTDNKNQSGASADAKSAAITSQKAATGDNNQPGADAASKTAVADKYCTRDTFSVFGQFELDSKSQPSGVGLGKFFATGFAARKLADGFAERLKNANVSDPQPKSADKTR